MNNCKKCPKCKSDMSQEEVKSHFDVSIILDQCQNCGGIWVEGKELYKIKFRGERGVRNLDEKLLGEIKCDSSIKDDELTCPDDSTVLSRPSLLAFPSDVEVDMCNSCQGVWFNQGELTQYQEYRRTHMSSKEEKDDSVVFKDEKTRNMVNTILLENNAQTCGDPSFTDGVQFKSEESRGRVNELLGRPQRTYKIDKNKKVPNFLMTDIGDGLSTQGLFVSLSKILITAIKGGSYE